MFEVKRALKAPLKDLDLPGGKTLNLYYSSRQARRTPTLALPCCILDLRGVQPDENMRMEDGTLRSELHSLPISIIIDPRGKTDDEAEDELEATIDAVLAAVESVYGKSFSTTDYFSTDEPYGNLAEAMSGAFLLNISNEL